MVAASADSNPGLAPSVIADQAVRLGHVSRTFAAWHEQDADRSFYLDGELLSIDGRETRHRGSSSDELAAVARLYAVHGPEFWERLDGSFCLVVRDGSDFRVGVDVAGTRAVYWWYQDGLLAFHSHLLDLAPSYPGALVEDMGALGHFLECGHYPPGTTAYRAVHYLGAGQFLSVVGGEVAQRQHFAMVYRAVGDRESTDQLVDRLVELVSASVSKSWRSARNPAVPLSGGMDSRYLAAEVVRQAGDPDAVRTITWGEDRSRADSDAVIAARVASTLGIENTWCEKPQRHSAATFERAIYLSSGEADCAIHYPNDHVLHAELVDRFGFESLFRGDQLFGPNSPPRIMTNRAVLPASFVVRLAVDDGYRDLIGPDVLEAMASEQANIFEAAAAGLESSTPHARMQEAWYEFGFRRELAPYNTVKNADLEMYLPFLDRPLLDWVRSTRDEQRSGKVLLRAALNRRFPELARIPFATRTNLPSWIERSRQDPSFAHFFREWCSRPGWLDTIGAKSRVLHTLEIMAALPANAASPPREHPRLWRQWAKKTIPGRLLREVTLERRYARNNLPPYLRLARLAVLHGLLGRIESRRAAPVPVRPEIWGGRGRSPAASVRTGGRGQG